jgi:hypothetical protein
MGCMNPATPQTSFLATMLRPRSLPYVTIVLPYEGRPRVSWRAQTDEDALRLVAWLGDNEGLAELMSTALDLAEAPR